MIWIRRLSVLSCLAALAVSPAFAFETPAKQAFILDYETGIPLYAKNAEEPMIPASMTKIMTSYVVFDMLQKGTLSPEAKFTVSQNAWEKGGWASGGSTMGLSIGESVSVMDLLTGVIVLSGNDACIVLAEGISGTEEAFAKEMTAIAQEMGLKTASFKNATGLDEEGHEISAADLAMLAKLSIETHPEYYGLYALPSFEWNGISQPNRNPILGKISGVDGLKTGHLSVSGYGLVASATEGDERRIVVINGLDSISARAASAERMMRAAFRQFEVVAPFEAGETVGTIPVWLGKQDTVEAVVTDDIAIGIESSERRDMSAKIVLATAVTAPIEEGQKIGTLVISGANGLSEEYPVVAKEKVSKIGLLGRAFEGFAGLFDTGVATSEPVTEAE
ncbi:D-alanyl-D-alanine carboxypeptidase family protein [Ponticaulis profundi]|uniref:serine-type D-Ala-D-Ala carboxypeptidase n=1 Tax=Ponticaulis profundi TaxID=2665222 RepID=A0ABW1SF00_9PROT